ncbi:hypothetical protein PHYPSEUDO_013582 [Phytophthora pseudosyringae]|uniref:Uncharacterized protein n=1 Tax=Phytophthora pseudosyringae TaxID=221518 RepID=A0A8T1VA37_9STRA|nr:hypothetical protein PHYPSEUDO_013582 [Phytophthora pseudosyringae]
MSPTTGASEATITFHNEPWTAEGARLLLEVDEGWIGYRGDAAWSWHDETYTAYSAVCHERKWPCNTHAACVAMLHALRTGAISMKLSDATRSSDGCAQWSLPEMRELGAQMRRVEDGKSQTVRWAAQLVAFVEAMKAKDSKYTIDDRTVEDLAVRAGKFVTEPILLLIDPKRTNGRLTPRAATKTRRTRRSRTPEPKKRVTRGQLTATGGAEDSDDRPLVPRRNTRTRATTRAPTISATTSSRTPKRRGRKRGAESEGDSSYHDPTSEDEDMLWADEQPLRVSEPEGGSAPATQEITSQGELLPVQMAADEKPSASAQVSADHGRSSLSQDAADQSRPSSATSQRRASPREDPPASPRQDEAVPRRASPSENSADRVRPANGNQNGGKQTRQPSRKYQRVQQPVVNDGISKSSEDRASTTKTDPLYVFRSLNPYDRQGKPWGEFVVEVLLAERTARNEDELDYVQFVRGLYEI